MARKFTKYPSNYVKAANKFRRQLVEDYPKVISMLHKYIREVARCENQAELEATEAYSSRGLTWDKSLQDITDFDEKIDIIIETFQKEIDMFKGFQADKLDEISREEQAVADIEAYLSSIGIDFDTQEDGIHVYPTDLSRESLISFIDNLIATLDGRYFGTGRGGSWSAWNVLINGIDFQIGPIDRVHLSYKGDENCWLIKS